jgi:hypothetical protein
MTMAEPSPRYFEALRASTEFHATHKTFNGRFFLRYIEDVKLIVDEFGCKTLLDYGCGKGKQWEAPLDLPHWQHVGESRAENYLGVAVTKFDPAWPAFREEPRGKFDIVVCTQVLGSIPIADLPWAVDRLYGYANKAVFIGERLGPVKKLVHAHMKSEMPHEWTWQQWADVLRRPGSDVAMFFKATDSRDGAALGDYRLQ